MRLTCFGEGNIRRLIMRLLSFARTEFAEGNNSINTHSASLLLRWEMRFFPPQLQGFGTERTISLLICFFRSVSLSSRT